MWTMARSVEDLQLEVPAEPTAVVTLTDAARDVVTNAIAQEPDPERLALWLEVRGVVDGAFVYDLYFQALSDAADDDAVFSDQDLPVVVPATSIDVLRGARLEWSEEGTGGLVLVNPNTPPQPAPSGVPDEVLAAGDHRAARRAGRVGARVGCEPVDCESRWTCRPRRHGRREQCRLPPALRRLSGLRHVAA